MPIIYLSPSTQENNFYVSGGTEEEWMNRLADAMVPYLDASGIQYVRNTPEMTAAAAIRASNEGNYDLHLALHSNAAPEGLYGQIRGIIVFYYPSSVEGKRAADLFAAQLKKVYPLPELVTTQATTALGEVRRPKYPANLIELGYHDNYDDLRWIENHLDAAAQAIARGLTEYFGLPFLYPQLVRTGIVTTEGAPLRLRSTPGIDGTIIAEIPNGASVQIYGSIQGWYSVGYGGQLGYAAQAYIAE